MREDGTTSPSSAPATPGRFGAEFSLASPSDPDWLIVEEGFAPAREHEIESIFAIVNGYVGTRASLEEGSWLSRPGVFARGVYVDSGHELGPSLAILPDWPHLEIAIDGDRLSIESGKLLEHRRVLDLHRGLLWREWRQQDASGRISRVRFLRLASLEERHALFQRVEVTAENYSGRLDLTARCSPSDARGARAPLVVGRASVLATMTIGKISIAMATESRSQPRSRSVSLSPNPSNRVEECWSWQASVGETVQLDRVVAMFTSREEKDPAKAAQSSAASLRTRGAATLVADHANAWSRHWDLANVRISGDEKAQRALRFALYHLIAAANPADERSSIGARGLTGEAYHGHVFWDTEIYMLPFYLLTQPAAARALLMYRYHTLDAARNKAKAFGYRGALYAWESADTGDEATPPAVVGPGGRLVRILTGEQEHHISADIAYAVWQYWRATGDDAFMLEAGGDVLVETARFWASRARIEADGRAHIGGVIGPDEYHETVDDDAFTNVMARWNLDRAADAVAILERERPAEWSRRASRLSLAFDEPTEWRRIGAALVDGFQADTGLFEQFEGYFELEEVDVVSHRSGATPLDIWLGSQRTRRSKGIKQADVVALSHLLWDEWPRAVHEANFDYYEPRTAHGSSLSPSVHALVAARLGKTQLALDYFHRAGEIDLADNMGNAAGGVHMGALGGLWQAVVFGVAGVSLREEGITLDPHLPAGWTELSFSLLWRERIVKLTVSPNSLRVGLEAQGDKPITVAVVDGPACHARPGPRYLVEREDAAWGPWRELD